MRIAGNIDSKGFTLLEMGIVLTIIGLVIGGVLVGTDLVRAAQERGQITQLEKYQSAVHTFDEKYGALPGDMNAKLCTQFGFSTCWQRGAPGLGDGNGVIEGWSNPGSASGMLQNGEPLMFWVDLSGAGLMDGIFSTATPTVWLDGMANTAAWWPPAKIGNGNFMAVWSGGWSGGDGKNYYLIMNIVPPAIGFYYGWVGGTPNVYAVNEYVYFTWWNGWELVSSPGPTVRQAFDIDTKIDDGLPQSGSVMAMSPMGGETIWSGSEPYPAGHGYDSAPWTNATPGNATTCFDNGGVNGAPQQYSMEINGGMGQNCALSIQFQDQNN